MLANLVDRLLTHSRQQVGQLALRKPARNAQATHAAAKRIRLILPRGVLFFVFLRVFHDRSGAQPAVRGPSA